MWPPETRSRRQSDPPNQVPRVTKLTRLTNGFSKVKDDHVTTRSQAKSSKFKNRLSKTLKQKLSPSSKGSDNSNSPPTSNNNNKNKYSSRLNGLVSSRTLVGRLENLEGKKLSRLGRSLNGNGLSHRKNLSSNNSNSSQRTTTGSKSQSQLLFTHHRYQNFDGTDKNGEPRTEKERVALQRAVAAEKRADRAKKRRSALWVLNCEAESFLFGETAADKHEVELPPLSPPPKKRRRIRTNELGNLLKESSIIGSKLRSPTPQPPLKDQSSGYSIKSKSDNTSTSARSPPTQKNNSKKLLLDLPRRKDLADLSLSVNVDDSVDSDEDEDDDDDDEDSNLKDEILSLGPLMKEDELTSISSPLSSVYSSLGSPNSYSNECNSSSNSQSVRIQTILTSMDLRFSFEDLPTDEIWYSTFQRQEHPETSALLTKARSYDYYNYGHSSFSYFSSSSPPALLPYETKLMNQPRSLTKGRLSRVRLPRKSPRCHASTLAILSSGSNLHKIRGRNRNSVLLPQSPALPTSSTTISSSGLPSPSSTASVSTPIPSTSTALAIPSIIIEKPAEEEDECKEKPVDKKQAMMTRKLSKNFSKAKLSRIPPHKNRLSLMKGKNNIKLNSPPPSSSSSSQNQLTVNSCWRLGSKSSKLPPVSPPMLSSRPQSPTPSPPTSSPDKSPHRIRDISATQYLWDSIQLLSDPYVIQVLAGEKAGTGKSPNSTASSSPISPVTVKSTKANHLSLRNASSKKDEDKDMCTDQDKTGTSSCRQHADEGLSMVTTGNSSLSSSKNSKLVPTPKNSPKNNMNNNNNNVNHGSNHINGVQLSKYPCSHTRHCKYKQTKVSSSSPSPQSSLNTTKNAKLNNNNNSNQLHNHNNNKNTTSVVHNNRNGIHTHHPRKSPRKSPISPIVLVSELKILIEPLVQP